MGCDRPQVDVCEGAADNLPDAAAELTASRIAQLASPLSSADLLLVLLSGGGSALLPAPRPPLTLRAKSELTRALAARGASIQELNTVRRAVSRLKGGGLACLAAPAHTLALVLSDVIGDPLELIASGPTVIDGSQSAPAEPGFSQSEATERDSGQPGAEAATREQTVPPGGESGHQPPVSHPTDSASAVLSKFGLLETPLVKETLAAAAAEHSAQRSFVPAHTVLVGSNRIALETMLEDARADHRAVLVSTRVSGDCDRVAKVLADLSCWLVSKPAAELPSHLSPEVLRELGIPAESLRRHRIFSDERSQPESQADRRPLCLLFGGETTVTLRGRGRGGRNQQMALAFAVELEKVAARLGSGCGVELLCCGTDGADGPTDAAGAVVDQDTARAARAQGLDPAAYLADNDSYGFFARFSGGSHHIRIGQTGTNVMDVMALVIHAPSHNNDGVISREKVERYY